MLTGGDLVLRDGHGMLPPLPRALLAVLLLQAGGDVSRDWLANLLWPETDQQTARRRLRMTLLNLRNALEGADCLRIEATRDALKVNVEPHQIDVFQFELAAASDHPDTRAMACNLYAGDLLARFPSISNEFDSFLDGRRAALHSVALSLLLDVMLASRDRGDAGSFERAFQKLVQIDPVNDAATCLAMERWTDAGQRERIEVEYRRFHVAYAAAFDAPPPEDITAAYQEAVERAARTPVSPSRREREITMTSQVQDKSQVAKSKKSRTLRAVILALACLTGLAWAVRELRPPTAGPVIMLGPADLVEEDCNIPDAARSYRQEIRDGLEGIEGASVVVGPIGRALMRSGDGILELRQSVTCRGDLLRATLTLFQPEASQVLWIGRFEASVTELVSLSNRLQAELATVPAVGAD